MFKDTRFRAFHDRWFAKHQPVLLLLLNAVGSRKIMRQLLNVPDSFPVSMPISRISSNSVHFTDGPISYASVSLAPIHSMAVYQHASWIWRIIHEWDTKVANRWFPSLNLGLDELENINGEFVTHGIAGYGYSNPNNWFYDWNTIRNASTGIGANTSPQVFTEIFFSNTASLPNRYCMFNRIIFSINTSTLNLAEIIEAKFLLQVASLGQGFNTVLYNNDVVLVGHSKQTSYVHQSNDITTADYDISKFGNTPFCTLNHTDFGGHLGGGGSYYIHLNEDGRNYLKQNQHTAFGLLLAADLYNMDFQSQHHHQGRIHYAFTFPSQSNLLLTYYTNSIIMLA
jgi:hypothetical protein